MILSDKTIKSFLQNGTLSISPLEDDQIQPASVDIRLGNTFSIVEDSSTGILTFTNKIAYKKMQAGSIPASRAKLHWNYLTRTAVPSNYRRAVESDSWYSPGWIRPLYIRTAANIRDSGALPVLKYT